MCSIPGLPSPGSNVSVHITRVNLNPQCVLVEFWGNFDPDQRCAYERLKKEIQNPGEAFHEAEGNPGDPCLVQVYETWYRACIVSRSTTEYSVFLMDEGKILATTTGNLAWGQPEFFYLPPEVEFCVLANVLPLSLENKWSKMSLEFMKTFCGRTVTACVQDVIVPQRTFLLDIPCYSKQMFEMGFAKNLPNERFRVFVTRSLQSHSALVNPQVTLRHEPSEHIEQTKNQHCYMYPELQTKTVETVIITEVTNPQRVFCQLKVFSHELMKLTGHITQHYEGRVGAHFAMAENLGAPCASRGNNGQWYRSILQQVMSSSNVAEVLHVDYGKKQFVQLEQVRPLEPEFFRMPVVTYVCSLHGVVDRDVGWTSLQIDYLKSLLLNRTVIARFEYQSLSEGVYYVTLYGDENTNLNTLFSLREKNLSDMKAEGDCAIQKRTIAEKTKISIRSQQENTDATSIEAFNGNKTVLSTLSLTPKTSHVAVVQYVDSPAKFWIQTQMYANEFDHLMQDLQEQYSDLVCPKGLIEMPVPGLLCLAKSQDGMFYRAAVCNATGAKAEVFFLDYGNTEWVDCVNLRELPLKYRKLPALAVRCALYGIQPVGEHWDQKATLYFSKAVVDKVLNVHILSKSQHTHIAQIIDLFSDGEQDVSKLLCNAGFAEEEGRKKTIKHNTKMGQAPLFETNGSQSSSSPAETENRSAFREYLFPIGSSVEVTVSYIDNPNDFWCQIASDAGHLKQLMQNLQDFYAKSEFQPPLGVACVARHPENGMWYRALVIQKYRTPHVTVLFVDYGQTRKVDVQDLRRINPAFLKLNGQAFRCSLFNLIHPVSHSPLDWSPEAVSLFQDFVDNAASMNVVLKCTVYAVMCNSQKVVFNVVDLETPFQSVCNLLVKRGLADRGPSKTSSLPAFHLDTYYYSTHNLKTGSEEEVTITCAENVNHFFCHLGRNSVEIEELANKVNNLCSQLENIDCPKKVAKICFAKYTDGLWYRGRITSTNPSIVVNFVDYGNTQEVENSDLLPIPIEAGDLMSVPVQAIEAGLSDIPENVPSEVNNWFENFVTDRPLRALVVAKEPNGKVMVELYDGKTQVNAMIREKFHLEVERNEQNTRKGFDFRDRSAQNASHNMIEGFSDEKAPLVRKTHENHENNLNKFNRGNETQQIPAYKISQKDEPDPEECPKKFSDFGDVRKGMVNKKKINLSSSHEEVCSDTAKGDYSKSNVLKQTDLPLKVVIPEQKAEVFVSHYNSPLSFFVQLVTDESDICSLAEKLNDDHSEYMPVNPNDCHEGDLVCAVFPEDNCWYRAVVRKAPIDGKYHVEFIDYGNTAEVSVSEMCTLDTSILSHPRYSIECSLTGVIRSGGEMDSNLKKEIEENADRITCTFINLLGSVWEVKLEASGQSLGSIISNDAAVVTAPPDALKSLVAEHRTSSISLCTYKNPDVSSGQTFNAFASYISGPQLFWCQYAEIEKLQEISDVIQKTGNTLEKSSLDDESLPVGGGCIALYGEDQMWYRAKVTSREQDILSIVFVDFGNESEVKMSEVGPLPYAVSDLPPQAFPCQLDGFDVAEGFWDDKADDKFFELITDKLLKVTVLKLGSYDLVTPHIVRVEYGDLVINEAMNICWIQNYKTSQEAASVLTCESSVVTEIESSECIAKISARPKTAVCPHSDVCVSVVRTQDTEIEDACTVVEHKGRAESVVMLDKDVVDMHVMESQGEEDSELGTEELVTDEMCKTYSSLTDTPAATENPEQNIEKAVSQDSDLSDTSSTQRFEVLRECLVDPTVKSKDAFPALPYTQPDEQQSFREAEFGRPEDNQEIIKSDLGFLRRVTEGNRVGLECATWSHSHKTWCRAQILKVSEETTLVLLVDHDSEMVVDPFNVFEVIPMESLQPEDREDVARSSDLVNKTEKHLYADVNSCAGSDSETAVLGEPVACDADTDMLIEDANKRSEGENCTGGFLDPLSKPEEMAQEAGGGLVSVQTSDGETPSAVTDPVVINDDEQPQDKQDAPCSGDLVNVADQPEDENRCLDLEPDIPEQMSELFDADVSVEQKEPEFSMDLDVDSGPNVPSDIHGQAQTEDTEQTSCLLEEQTGLTPQDQDQNMKSEPESDVEALIEEVNSFTEDQIDLTSDTDLESDVSSNEMLHGAPAQTEPLPATADGSGLQMQPSISDSEETLAGVTHLTLKVEDF